MGFRSPPLLTCSIQRLSDECPFLNPEVSFELRPGEILWLKGASGAGKSLTCMNLAGLAPLPGARVTVTWDAKVPVSQRVGFLFQKGVLIDSLNLAENIALALRACNEPHSVSAINTMLEAVGLSGKGDGSKMPGELSGGMLRRSALAQILAQKKRLVILDEPFVGLDPAVAREVAQLVRSVAVRRSVAFVLVSHEAHLTPQLGPMVERSLDRARCDDSTASSRPTQLGRLPFSSRAGRQLADYFFYSLPLIVTAFIATGAAISMLLADLLQHVDVVAIVSGFLEAYLTGNPILPAVLGLVDRIVKSNEAAAKRKLYAIAIGTVFTVELGPLLAALLLAGRIGGSYAGEISMMAATNQLDLLAVLNVKANTWTFYPSLLAALLAAPALTAVGTWVALQVGALLGSQPGVGIMEVDEYWEEIREWCFIRQPGGGQHLLKWAPLVNVYRSVGFMTFTMCIAQGCSHWRRAQPRHVPLTITSAVVTACLAVLTLDWAFSQMYVRLDTSHMMDTDASAIYLQPETAASAADLTATTGEVDGPAAHGRAVLTGSSKQGLEPMFGEGELF